MKKLVVPLIKNDSGAGLPLPSYATPYSAGMDLYAATSGIITIEPNSWEAIPTGISVAIPYGFEGQIRSRSGLSLKEGICVLNAPGTIDADYRGEINVILHNVSKKVFLLKRGMRIAQLVITPVVQVEWEEINKLNTTTRNTKGFGSTGV